jgi:low affinity Fe/Cu permease
MSIFYLGAYVMKMDKTTFAAIFALAIAGVLLNSGCSGPEFDNNTPIIRYIIELEPEIENGMLDVSPRHAEEGEIVTITAIPNAGYAPTSVRVRDFLNFPVLPVNPGANNTWTFEMPAVNVRIGATFSTLREAMVLAVESLSETSSWEEIDTANNLIIKLQESLAARSVVAIDAETISDIDDMIAILAGNGQDIGLISKKMRNEDLTEWINLTWPSHSIDKGVSMDDREPTVTTPPRPQGENRTHLYYVAENNPALLPALTLGKGWKTGERIEEYSLAPIGLDIAGVKSIQLIYTIGINKEVSYYLLLVPVAQYTLLYEEGATGAVNICDFRRNPEQGEALVLNATRLERTGYIGRAAPGLNPPFTYFVRISSAPNTVVTVKDSNDQIVTRTCRGLNSRTGEDPGTCATACSGAEATCGALDGTRNIGFFFPRSQQYTITVSPAPSY